MNRLYIFTVEDLTKKFGTREVLNNIWLAFFPGAKIGVLGRNGAGKSTLLRIMAGWDKDYDGVARLTEGFTCGYLPQEPQLDPHLDVWGNLQQAVAPRRRLVERYNEIAAQLSKPLDASQMQKLCDEMARLQDQIEAQQAWEIDRQLEIAIDVMNLPPPQCRRVETLRRRKTTRGFVQVASGAARSIATR